MKLAEPKSPLKLKLFEALEEAFPQGDVTVKDYSPGHPKLAKRGLVHPHIGVSVKFTGNDEKQTPYGIAGMIPAAASENDVLELLARLADDKRRSEESLVPTR